MSRTTWRQLGVWVIVLALLRLAVIPPEETSTLEAAELRSAVAEAAGWMARVQAPSGYYLYEYDADADIAADDYNEVRHAGVTLSVFQAAGQERDPELIAAGDRGIEWMEAHLHRYDGWAALTNISGTRAKLGGTALATVALAERRLLTGDTRHDELMREFGRFMAAMQREDGGFYIAWQPRLEEPDTVGISQYFPGEALWALALLHEAFPGEGWDEHARAASEFITTMRDEVDEVRFPPLADHWGAYGLAEMTEWGLRDFEIDYARRLAARFGFLIRAESQREHGLFGGPGRLIRGPELPSSAFGTWVEGLAALWRLSTQDERMADLRPLIEERLAVGASLLARRQVNADEAEEYARPDLVQGTWIVRGETRMDDQQHALSGLLYTANALEGRTERAPDPLPAAGVTAR